ncbi:MAG: putrescine/spermidine ABC transporter permease [Rhodobacteraceae bacterium]|nr:putrescine/spermidine ABC transporter permease [Paracoccaceae bacterium]
MGAGAIVVTVVAIALLAAVAFPVYGLVFRRFFGGGLKALSIRSLIAAVVSVVAGILAVVIVFAVISFFFPSVVSLLEVDDYLYFQAYLSSLKIAAISTALTLLVGYPMAYGMARSPNSWRPTLMMLVILPFWTSFLIRVYAWRGILSQEGYLNQVLLWLGVIGEPLTILNTNTAVYIGVVYTYLPFMILPIYAALEKLDVSLIEAAEDLGCSRSSAFWLVTIPLSRPGIVAGCFLVFIPTLGEFVIPSLLGGSGTLMIGKVLWEEFFNNRDWPVASAVAIILLLILIVPIVLFQRNQQRQAEAGG